MDERFETGYIEINALAYQRVLEYADHLHHVTAEVRRLAGEVDALNVPGSSVLAAELLLAIDPTQDLRKCKTDTILDATVPDEEG